MAKRNTGTEGGGDNRANLIGNNMDKKVLMFVAQAVDAMPSQSTDGMILKAAALQWISAELEKPEEDLDSI